MASQQCFPSFSSAHPDRKTREERRTAAIELVKTTYSSWHSHLRTSDAKIWADSQLGPAIEAGDWQKVFRLTREQDNKGLQQINAAVAEHLL
jgi:hypothetical protein